MTIHIIYQVGILTHSNKLQKKAIRSIRLANIIGTAELLSTIADNDDGEADDETGDGEEADNNDDEDDRQEETKDSLKSIMLANIGSLKLGSSVAETELLKLINSSCINLISNKYKELYQKVIPLNTFQQIWRTCDINKYEYQASCQSRTKELINELFDDLIQFQFEYV